MFFQFLLTIWKWKKSSKHPQRI